MRNDARKYLDLGYSKVFVWPNPEDPTDVWGYYTLSASTVARADLINRHERKAPKGLPVPVALIGYMGRSESAVRGLGAVLIHDAALRVSRNVDIATWGLALEPEVEGLVPWYTGLGFVAAKQRERFMYGPLSAFLSEGD